LALGPGGQAQTLSGPPVLELKASDGTVLKASYFAAPKPGPGVLLFHQSNRTRQSWEDVARQLAAVGINTPRLDSRGHGESGGKFDSWTDPNREQARRNAAADVDAAFQFLISQPGATFSGGEIASLAF
jgi:alpha-beta hydrolase superfamily lysophospholipase